MQRPPRDLDLVSLNLFHLLTASLIRDPLRVLHLIWARCPRVPFSGVHRRRGKARLLAGRSHRGMARARTGAPGDALSDQQPLRISVLGNGLDPILLAGVKDGRFTDTKA